MMIAPGCSNGQTLQRPDVSPAPLAGGVPSPFDFVA
jgi:hypothetical protein